MSGPVPLAPVNHLAMLTDYIDPGERLREIPIPALIMAGHQDPLVPLAHVEALHAGLPQATLLVLEETEHDLDRATADGERARAAVQNFLAGFELER